MEKVLKRFNMENAKPVSCPLPTQIKLSKKMSPKGEEEKKR